MYERNQITYRPPPDLMKQITERAEASGLSLNQWLNRAVAYAIINKGATVKTVTTEEWTL